MALEVNSETDAMQRSFFQAVEPQQRFSKAGAKEQGLVFRCRVLGAEEIMNRE